MSGAARRGTGWLLALLLLLTAVVYARSVGFEFVGYDDSQRITENPIVGRGLDTESVLWAWTTTEHAPYWHPLSWISHLLDVELWGMNPAGHHATNVILHLVNTLLVFLVWSSATHRPGPSLAVAALFALHPVQAGTVAWVAARPDLLAALLALLALLAHGKKASWPRREPLALLFFAMAILAKPSIAALALMIPLWDGWSSESRSVAPAQRIRSWLPWLFVASLGTVAVLIDAEDIGGVEATRAVGLPSRLANAVVSIVRYVGKLVWPGGYAVHYPHPDLPGGRPWSAWQVGLALAAVVAVSLLVGRRRTKPVFRLGWSWFLVGLLPVLGLLQVGDQAIALRYLYVPMLGLVTAAVWTAASLGRGSVLVAILVLASAVATWVHLTPWRDERSLYLQALSVSPDDPVMHYNLGLAYAKLGGREREAERHYRRAIDVDGGYAQPRINLGHLRAAAGEEAEALSLYEAALRIDPDSGLALNGMGIVYSNRGDHARALGWLERAVRAEPERIDIRLNLALAHERARDALGRDAVLRELLRLDPENARARDWLGRPVPGPPP